MRETNQKTGQDADRSTGQDTDGKTAMNKDHLNRRIMMTVLGVTIAGFSVGFFTHSAMGLDPFQVFAHGTWTLTPLDYGTYYMLLNAALLVIIFFCVPCFFPVLYG